MYNLKWSGIDLDNNLIHVDQTKSLKKGEMIPMNFELKNIFTKMPQFEKEYVFQELV